MRFLRRLMPGSGLKMLDSRSAYRLWSETYTPNAHNPLMYVEEAAMRELLPPLDGHTVLDLACGTGRYTRIAYELGAACVYSFDNSSDMLLRGQVPAACAADLTAIPLPSRSVDVIICGLALGHVKSLSEALGEIARVLVPGGIACVSDLHPYQTLSGAKRTFAASDGESYAVEHYLHLLEDYITLSAEADLWLHALREPRLSAANGNPVVLALRFVRGAAQDDLRLVSMK